MRSLLLLPILLGFSVPIKVKATTYCGNMPNGWTMMRYYYDSDPIPPVMNYYLMRQTDNLSQWGVWNCDGDTGKSEWNVKYVDCITANTKFMNKSNKSVDTYCQNNGFE